MLDLSLIGKEVFLENEENKEIQKKAYNIYNYEENTHKNIQMQMIIKNKCNENIIGQICSYNYNKIDGYTYIDINMDDNGKKEFYIETCQMFFNYIFTCFPIRKLYFEGYKYELEKMRILKEIGFEIEGNLKQHNFFCGKYYDKYILSINRKDFYKGTKW